MPGYRKVHRRKKAKRRMIFIYRRVLVALLAFVAIFSLSRLIMYAVHSVQTSNTNKKLQQTYDSLDSEEHVDESVSDSEEVIPTAEITSEPELAAETSPTDFQYIGDSISASAAQLYAVNPDLIGWMKIPGVVNLPVVYRDNEYYLTHDFYGKESRSGTLFLDAAHPFRSDTRYLLIHGHAMNDGSMFGMITHYRFADYIAEHPYLTLNTLYGTDEYEIIGSCYLSTDEMLSVAKLGHPTFDSEEFEALIDDLRSHSMHFTKDEIPADSAILALSTCYKEGRIVAFFRRISSTPSITR